MKKIGSFTVSSFRRRKKTQSKFVFIMIILQLFSCRWCWIMFFLVRLPATADSRTSTIYIIYFKTRWSQTLVDECLHVKRHSIMSSSDSLTKLCHTLESISRLILAWLCSHCRFICLFVCLSALIAAVWSQSVMKLGMYDL